MQITYLGQSAFQVKTNGKTIIFDPMISPNELAKDINVHALEADYLLLTHAHFDHVADAEIIAKNNEASIIGNWEMHAYYSEKGYQTHPMNHGGKWVFDFGTAKYVNAVHSSTFENGVSGGNPGGYVIWNEEICFYHAGDTALTMDMKLIPMTCPKLDFAILPLGDNFTMGVRDAVIGADFIECDTIIGCHYDTFGFIEIDHQKAVEAFAKEGKKLILLKIGETKEF